MRAFAVLACAGLTLALAAPVHAAEKAERKKGGGLSYTQFPALTATIVRPDGRRGVLSVEAGIDCPDPAVKARADLLEPRLRDAYVQFLGVYAAALAAGSLPDADQIGAGLQRRTDAVVGRPGARLLLGSILVN
jgi:hypothetical protein